MQTDYYYLAMEYCPDGDLKNLILRKRSLQQKFDIKQVVEWAVQIAAALKFCHDRKVIHRDLKVNFLMYFFHLGYSLAGKYIPDSRWPKSQVRGFRHLRGDEGLFDESLNSSWNLAVYGTRNAQR